MTDTIQPNETAEWDKLGLFYLGKAVDPESQEVTSQKIHYDSKDLVTHAVCVGMTGSGKTGLCITLLEEAAIDRTPAIIVDPKGDLTNLALLFKDLSPGEFRDWINEEEAAQKEMSIDDYARDQADVWRRGLADWDQGPERIRRLLKYAEISIYTPGSDAGLQLSVFKHFNAPPREIIEDTDLFRERILTTASALLGLLGIQAEPLLSREHILISNILESNWREGQGLDLPALIQKIQTPPFERIGVFELDAFYPAADRYKLAMMINNLLAAPGFESWLLGGPLDINSLLYESKNGQLKPRLAILSIAHLSDAERMFFVTLLLNQLLGWMHTQNGTSSLRAIFYMDEIFGYFPPVSEPPAKRPLLTLLKQARAFGLGIVLTTQNTMDLDYKGLANAGTWFIGRLQTDRDKDRILEGLSGVGGNIDLRAVSRLISGLKKRVFLMHNVHEDAPVLFNTRWALSYLRGPLTRQQIANLMKEQKQAAASATGGAPSSAAFTASSVPVSGVGPRAPLDPAFSERFYPAAVPPPSGACLVYHPAVAALAQVAIFDNRLGISHIADAARFMELGSDVIGLLWERSFPLRVRLDDLKGEPPDGALFLPVPPRAAALLKSAGDDYADYLARSYQLSLWKSLMFRTVSQPGEAERDFRIRLGQQARERRDAEVEKLRQKYGAKINSLQNQLMLAQQRLQREEEQYRGQMTQTAISMGSTILGAILGRKASQIGRATTSARGASRAYYEKMDIQRAQQQVDLVKARLEDMERQLRAEADRLGAAFDPAAETLQAVILRPKKKDIAVQWSGLLWLPFWHLDGGAAEPGFPVVQS